MQHFIFWRGVGSCRLLPVEIGGGREDLYISIREAALRALWGAGIPVICVTMVPKKEINSRDLTGPGSERGTTHA